MKLLVSVRSVEEALLAAEGGADFIDLKEPGRGALGGLPVATIREIVAALRDGASKKLAEYQAWNTKAADYARAHGRYEDVAGGGGRQRYTHNPDPAHAPPADPPKLMEWKVPEIPVRPAPLLTAAEIRKRQEQLLSTLMDGSQPLDFIARVKDAAVRLGLRLGERR